MDVGLLLDRQPPPAGRRIALIGNVGGPLILGADAADAGGLDVPVLSAPCRRRSPAWPRPPRRPPIPSTCPRPSPPKAWLVSSSPSQHRARWMPASSCVSRSTCTIGSTTSDSLLAAVEPAGVPLVLTLIGYRRCRSAELPVFSTPERAAAAMAIAAQRAGWLATIAEEDDEPAEPDASSWVAVRRLARGHIDAQGDTGWLDPASFVRVARSRRRGGGAVGLRRLGSGLRRCRRSSGTVGRHQGRRHRRATQVRRRRRAARHRRPGATAAEVYRGFEHRFGPSLRGVLVQTQLVTAPSSCFIGAVRDPTFGPHRGRRGRSRGRATRRPGRARCPRVQNCARRAVESLRLAPLFHGFRGRPELPVDAVVEFVHRLGLLAATVPEIQQLDLNPVLVSTAGCVAVDALVARGRPRVPGGTGARPARTPDLGIALRLVGSEDESLDSTCPPWPSTDELPCRRGLVAPARRRARRCPPRFACRTNRPRGPCRSHR